MNLNITANQLFSFPLHKFLLENKTKFTNASFVMLSTLYKETLVNDTTVIHYQYEI